MQLEITTADRIINGLKIIEKHRPKNQGYYHIRCEHDEFIAGSLTWGIPETHMEDLGWTPNEDYDGFVFLV